ncbi:MAG: leucine-rich repeat domain-containing protein [Prevotella sp.]|nr:leucine-rich repeat domain-containing protein [Prevotella sp.]
MKKVLLFAMKRLLAIALLLFPLFAHAEEVEIDGLWYDLNAEDKTAEVMLSKGEPYSGDIVIPEKVSYEDAEYSVTSIRSAAFRESAITSIEIPNSVKDIGVYAFEDCSSLTSVDLPKGLTSINNSTFRLCSALTSIGIPEGVTKIGEDAFCACSSLTSITIPKSVTEIEDDAFTGCFSLKAVHITDLAAWCSITFWFSESNPLWYAKHLFLNGEEIKDLVIPESVTEISEYAFVRCLGLTSVTISDNVTAIKAHAFYNCEGITSVRIGNGVTTIGNKAFEECNSLKAVHIQDIAAWCNITFAYRGNPLWYARHLYLNGEEVKDLVIPDGVTTISKGAFQKCAGLTKATISNSVTEIGASAFSDCTSLLTIIIGNGIKTIGKSAFAGCSKYRSVYCYAEEVPEAQDDSFGDSDPINAALRVPAKSVLFYEMNKPWSRFWRIYALKDEDLGIEEKEYQKEQAHEYYSPNGQQVATPGKGMNIAKMSNGQTRKILIK